MLMLPFKRNAPFQRCLQKTNIDDVGTSLIHLFTDRMVERNFCHHSVIGRGYSSFVNQQYSLLSCKNHGLNSLGSWGIQRYGPGWNPRTQLQTYRRLKVSALSLISKRRQRQKITMITAYDFPSAIHVARANIDIVLVGDSVAMVELGHVTTQPISMNDMIHHCSAVERGVSFANVPNPPLLVGDMPFGSYEFEDTDIALQNAYRFVKEAGMDAVKLEVR
jgi:hypothetical protein